MMNILARRYLKEFTMSILAGALVLYVVPFCFSNVEASSKYVRPSNNITLSKDVQELPKPVSGSPKVILIKGRFRHTHSLTHQDFWDIISFCGGRWIRDGCPTHVVVDFKWANSGDPRLENGPKLMKPGWLMASKNGVFANSVEYQWTPEKAKKANSKNHIGDHGLLTPPDSLHHSTTIEREHQSAPKHSKNSADIVIRVVKDVRISFLADFGQIPGYFSTPFTWLVFTIPRGNVQFEQWDTLFLTNTLRFQRLKTTTKVSDIDGYYIIDINAAFTDKWKLNVQYALGSLLIQSADQITGHLGEGTFGRVIKALEQGTSREVAIKITRAKDIYRDAAKIEIRVLATLKARDPENSHQCLQMMDYFDYKGHICIVMDLLGQSLYKFFQKNRRVPFPDTHIQIFARQLFKSVAYLHRQQIIHTDIKPDNILLYDDQYRVCLYKIFPPKLRWELLNPKICLIDFGSATFQNEDHEELITTSYYRALEVILKLGWSFPCDIWSIGCVLVELLTGSYLFRAYSEDDAEHLAMMEKVVGQKVNDFLAQSGFKPPDDDREFYDYLLHYPSKYTTKESKQLVKNMKNLSDIVPSGTPFFQQFLDLLQKIFVFDPSKRITAEQALNHPWLKEN